MDTEEDKFKDLERNHNKGVRPEINDITKSRRNFIKNSALGLSTLTLPSLPIFAGPFTYDENGHLIPENKRLSLSWIKSLYERGRPEVLTGDELKYVGMPIGGIACGQLYIGGDGSLWLWHIFNIQYRRSSNSQLLTTMEQGGHFAYPDNAFKREHRPVEQGVAIKVIQNGKEYTKKLNSEGFKNIEFRGEYPMSKIRYLSNELPVEVNLEAFSPFIPGELDKSANPCTIFNYTIKNTSSKSVKVYLAGWLENAVNPYENNDELGKKTARLISSNNRKTIFFASETSKDNHDLRLEDQHGFGSMGWTLYKPSRKSKHALNIGNPSNVNAFFEALEHSNGEVLKESRLNHKTVSVVSESIKLKPGEKKQITFILSWFFPHLNQQEQDKGKQDVYQVKGIEDLKLHYFNRFKSSNDVAAYISDNFDELINGTRNWNKIWYNSTLPYWLLDRSFIALNCIASNTLLWFNNNRFWGWEGVECCPGTCTHVWQYAQALAHIFPEVERNFREVTDLSELGLNPDGSLRNRAENEINVAHDGHSGTIMRMYREHKKSPDNLFLSKNYPNIKKMVRFIMSEDKDRDGILEGKQQNTLDAAWYGPMGWISSLYLGALAAGEQMALEMDDVAFAEECKHLLVKGRKNIVAQVYNGEYFIHIPDKDYPEAINTNNGCHIDQVLGQSFAHNLGIKERVIPQSETVSSLEAIWKYNFAPDAFDYQLKHKEIKGPRIYATQGEAATLMCTWPKGGSEKAVPGMDKRPDNPKIWSGPGIYFDETMNGFEYQVASHMIWEGMLEKGLATARAVHDRYTAKKRNPFNEVECSDHYSRSMASYGVFLAVCGFDYHGPKGILSFAPKLTPEDFKAPFTVAEGWGSFTQHRSSNQQKNTIRLSYGQLILNEFSVELPEGVKPSMEMLKVNGQEIKAEGSFDDHGKYRWTIELVLSTEDELETIVRFK